MVETKTQDVQRTERGWPGHFCGGSQCSFHRNTLLVSGGTRIIVSTVGNYHPVSANPVDPPGPERIGLDRFYETMVFRATRQGSYWDAEVQKQVEFDSPWRVGYIGDDSDDAANGMHEDVVKEIAERLRQGATFPKRGADQDE